jgi:lipopolysaccharide heptosyltransferase II
MSSRRSSSPSTSGSPWPADSWHGPILVVRLSSLGDVVLATTAVNLLKSRRPDLRIDMLTRRPYDQMLHGMEAISEVITADPDDSSPETTYELVLDLQGGSKGARACGRYAPAARRLTYDRAALRRRLLVATGNRIAPPEKLAVRFGRLIAGRDLPLDQFTPTVVVSEPHLTRLAAQLSAGEQPSRGWVLLSPGASKRLKAIPPRLIEALREKLLAEQRGVIELKSPGTADSGVIEGDGLSRYFRGPLITIAPLLSLVDGVIASDSGMLHMATAVKTPAIGLNGPTVPELGFSPLGNSGVVGVDLWCRPCHIHGPDRCWRMDEKCWADHDVDTIITELDNLI